MEAVGQLTGGIAHDFNNLLTIILANLQLLEDELAPGSLSRDLADSATRAALRGADLTRKLLVFARRQQLEAAPLDVNERVSSMTGMLTRTLGEHIQIRETLAPGLPPALVDAGQLETALLNLAVNARDAMAARRPVIDRNLRNDRRRRPTRPRLSLAKGAYVSIRVCRHRNGDERRGDATRVRALLHDEGHRQGHGPRPQHGVRLRDPIGRRRHAAQRTGSRHLGDASFAARRRRQNRRGDGELSRSPGIGDDPSRRGR